MNDRIPSFDPTRSLSGLIRTPVYVEDRETAIYLEHLLPELATRFEFKVAGGQYGVVSRVTTDRNNHPKGRAFGIRDRDYGPADEIAMLSAARPTYVLQRFEIENYCLDWDAISAFAHERLGKEVSTEVIGAFAQNFAKDILYAVAYNSIVASLGSRLNRKLPTEARIYVKPYGSLTETERKNTVVSRAELEGRLQSCELQGWTMQSENIDIGASVSLYADALGSSDASWTKIFPGKEILRAICHNVLNMPATLLTSLVMFIADSQLARKAVPEELATLAKQLEGEM